MTRRAAGHQTSGGASRCQISEAGEGDRSAGTGVWSRARGQVGKQERYTLSTIVPARWEPLKSQGWTATYQAVSFLSNLFLKFVLSNS